jgi:predicted small metal-binding protein
MEYEKTSRRFMVLRSLKWGEPAGRSGARWWKEKIIMEAENMIEVHGQDLGVEGCIYNARGETAEDVMTDMFDHLRKEHDMDMPPAEDVLEITSVPEEAANLRRGVVVDPSLPRDKGVQLVIQRLLERLDLSSE